VKWIQDYEDAFTSSQNWLNLDKRLGMMIKSRSVGFTECTKYCSGDTVFDELVSDKSFIET
jgi:hypothetical protein